MDNDAKKASFYHVRDVRTVYNPNCKNPIIFKPNLSRNCRGLLSYGGQQFLITVDCLTN